MIASKRILTNKLSEMLSKYLEYDLCAKIADRLMEALEDSGRAIVPQKVAVVEIITDREGMFLKIGDVEIEVETLRRIPDPDCLIELTASSGPSQRFSLN